jgi:hypothetical protein
MAETYEVKSTPNYALLKLPDHAFIYKQQRNIVEMKKQAINTAIETFGSLEAAIPSCPGLLVVVSRDNFEIVDEVYNYYAYLELGLPVWYVLT